jgi:hypothetical protein
MKSPRVFENIAILALAALSLFAVPTAAAQTIIGNETLVSTTFVVNQQIATARCRKSGCGAKTSMFAPITVTCPAAIGQTCTFHISLDTKTSIVAGCGDCAGGGPTGFYQFLVDNAPPTIGPTGKDGSYVFEEDAYTGGEPKFASRQSDPASVLGAVTNSSSNSHTIVVGVGCLDNVNSGGCAAIAHWSTMRIDIFEP